jgi:REP element-mobilizing transposase RayT
VSTVASGSRSKRPATYGRGRAVRLDAELYATDTPIHLTVCAASGGPFGQRATAEMVCEALARTTDQLAYRLFAYCLMPDHLHVLPSPHDSETAVAVFLRRFKSFTTRRYQKATGQKRLWQYSARDRVLRKGEDLLGVATYIANNPVRRGLVEAWTDWPYTKVPVE